MRKKSIMYVAIAVIATMFLTSCDRYSEEQSLESKEITNVNWTRVASDSVKKDIVRYFLIIGKKNTPGISEVVIHKQFDILHVPDNLIKDIPMYHKCFYNGSPMITEREVHRVSGPTLWKAPQVMFTLEVMEPVNFDKATVKITTRDARIFWQVVLIFFTVLFGFFAVALFNGDDEEWGIFLYILSIGILVWTWFYVPYFVSGLLTSLLVAVVAFQIRIMFPNKSKEQSETKG